MFRLVLSGFDVHTHPERKRAIKRTYHAVLGRYKGRLCGFQAFGSRSQSILVDVHVSNRRKVPAVKGRFSEAREACQEDEFRFGRYGDNFRCGWGEKIYR